jgi:hypothetical protein
LLEKPAISASWQRRRPFETLDLLLAPMDLETLWYELLPYFYGLGGLALLLSDGSRLLKSSGVVLVAAAAAIVWRRWSYRRALYVEVPHVHDVVVPRSAKSGGQAPS